MWASFDKQQGSGWCLSTVKCVFYFLVSKHGKLFWPLITIRKFFIPEQWGKLPDCGWMSNGSAVGSRLASLSQERMAIPNGCSSAMCSLIPCESDLSHTRISLGQLLNGELCHWDSCSYKTHPSWKWARSSLGSLTEPFCNSLGTCMTGEGVGLTSGSVQTYWNWLNWGSCEGWWNWMDAL